MILYSHILIESIRNSSCKYNHLSQAELQKLETREEQISYTMIHKITVISFFKSLVTKSECQI